MPDYAERAQLMCEEAFQRLYVTGKYYGDDDGFGIHPFMCGRCQDFGTYRCEKELDVCDWDIVGSELCRTTTMSLQGQAKASRERRSDGPTLDYMMVEAKGCGDRHCRIIAETVKRGYVTRKQADHILWCVLEAAGKAMFGER